jgi:hypothetical protein
MFWGNECSLTFCPAGRPLSYMQSFHFPVSNQKPKPARERIPVPVLELEEALEPPIRIAHAHAHGPQPRVEADCGHSSSTPAHLSIYPFCVGSSSSAIYFAVGLWSSRAIRNEPVSNPAQQVFICPLKEAQV